MLRYLVLVSLIFFNISVLADANDGEYLGFKLGGKFTAPGGSVGADHITGAMIYAVNPGQHFDHIDWVSVYVSPKSSIVGSIFGEKYFSNPRAAKVFADRYLSTLEKKYAHWIRRGRSLTNGDYQLWVSFEEKRTAFDDWPSDKIARVDIALIFTRDSVGRNDWMSLIASEVGNLKIAARN